MGSAAPAQQSIHEPYIQGRATDSRSVLAIDSVGLAGHGVLSWRQAQDLDL